jgi:catechol 2,3-dioxygenase-like lactoylglutathione lyase family enzyme
MATIRYIAIMARDPEALADFYKRFLAMKEIARSPEGNGNAAFGNEECKMWWTHTGI